MTYFDSENDYLEEINRIKDIIINNLRSEEKITEEVKDEWINDRAIIQARPSLFKRLYNRIIGEEDRKKKYYILVKQVNVDDKVIEISDEED